MEDLNNQHETKNCLSRIKALRLLIYNHKHSIERTLMENFKNRHETVKDEFRQKKLFVLLHTKI